MKRIGYFVLACVATCAFSAAAFATPNPNSSHFNLRIFNDCPFSTLNAFGAYPGTIVINDDPPCTSGFANLHSWMFSDDGGASNVKFQNNSAFEYGADFELDGNGNGGGGLMINPWWSASDGQFNLKTEGVPAVQNPGEIACFGGRLPFFSFTTAFGLRYAKGIPVHLDITYLPHSLSAGDPATIEYKLTMPTGGPTFDSGPLAFDQGNPAEDPPHGQWGMLNALPTDPGGTVGGHLMPFINTGGNLKGTWSNIVFTNLDAVPANHTTWGRIQTLYR